MEACFHSTIRTRQQRGRILGWHDVKRKRRPSRLIDTPRYGNYNEQVLWDVRAGEGRNDVFHVSKAVEFETKTGARLQEADEHEERPKGVSQTAGQRTDPPHCVTGDPPA